MLIALYAALAMVVSDILATILVQAEARNKAWLAALMDAFGWGAALIVTFLSINALNGHQFSQKVWVVALVTVANIVGTYTGTMIGKRWVKDNRTSVAARLKILETHLGIETPDGQPTTVPRL